MDKLFEGTLGKSAFGERLFEGGFEPVVDVYEDNEKIEIKAELPGMDQKDIQVNIEGNMLSIKGEKKFEREEKKKNYQRIERSYGSFTRTFSIPGTVDQDKIKASFKKGVLTMSLSKKEEEKPKQIAIDGK
jgi:HSP20 family protein